MRMRDGRRQGGGGEDVDEHAIQTARGGRGGRGCGDGTGKWDGSVSAGRVRPGVRFLPTQLCRRRPPREVQTLRLGGHGGLPDTTPPLGAHAPRGGGRGPPPPPPARPNGTTKPKRRPPSHSSGRENPREAARPGGCPAGQPPPPPAPPPPRERIAYRGAAGGGGGAPGGLPRRRNPGERGGRRPAALQLPRSPRGAAASGCRQERAALRLSGRPTQPSDLPLLSSAADAPPRPMNQAQWHPIDDTMGATVRPIGPEFETAGRLGRHRVILTESDASCRRVRPPQKGEGP